MLELLLIFNINYIICLVGHKVISIMNCKKMFVERNWNCLPIMQIFLHLKFVLHHLGANMLVTCM